MKNLYVLIIILLCFNYITIDATKNIHKQKTEYTSSSLNSNFDATIAYLSKKWQLNNLQPFTYPSLFNNYIARAYSHTYQQDIVLKICESNDECKALQHLQSDGIVNLFDYDHEYCALLLQYIPSQICLNDFLLIKDDNFIIDAFVDLFKKIHTSPKALVTQDFKTVHNDFALLSSYTYIKVPQDLLQKAIQLSDQLLISNEPQYLLHCDLHCRNILQYQDSFIAIDPWASVGPLEYEVAPFLSSPTDFLLLQDNTKEILQNRLNRLSKLLNFNKKILKNYAFMRVILLACMCEIRNKNDDWIDQFIQVARIIDQLNENE